MSQHSSRGPAWESLRKAVLERDGYICAHCGAYGDTADHIIPKVMGGLDVMENLITLCRPCNAKKGAQLLLRSAGVNPRWLDAL